MTTDGFREQYRPPPFGPIDVHVHLGPSDTGELYYPRLSGDDWLALADAAGVELACAFPPLRARYGEANRELAAWAATTDGRVRAFARLGGPDIPLTIPALWMLRRKLNYRLRGRPSDLTDPAELDRYAGVKLLPHLDGLPSDRDLGAIAARRLPVVVHGGTHVPPRWIEQRVLPRVAGPVIIAHLGAFPCDERLLRDAVDLAAREPRVWLDTSGAWLAEFIRHAARAVPHKLLFASDAPLAHPLVAWYHLASAVHDDALLTRIGGGNAREVLG